MIPNQKYNHLIEETLVELAKQGVNSLCPVLEKMLQTRFGKLKLDIPKAKNIEFYPNCLEKGTHSEKALGLAIAEMYVNGVSTRRVKKRCIAW